MFKRENKLALFLVILAICSFAVISLGGEFLHNRIHHHSDQPSHDECSFSLLLTQAVIAAIAVIIFAITKFTPYLISSYSLFVFQPSHNLPNLRAPPVVL